MPIERKHKGAWAEIAACAWLLAEGYEVFRNVSQHGLADLIATKGTDILKLDVKFVPGKTFTALQLTHDQQQAGVVAIGVFASGQCKISPPAPQIRDYETGEPIRRRPSVTARQQPQAP